MGKVRCHTFFPIQDIKQDGLLKSGSQIPKKNFFICFNDSPSKMMEYAFYFI